MDSEMIYGVGVCFVSGLVSIAYAISPRLRANDQFKIRPPLYWAMGLTLIGIAVFGFVVLRTGD
jgi:hypothetical protein